ncbi:uncharacterized protein LOC134281808 [Saccostrea cucullata]|uniref:uncharacterized protein LOC134281808 n=1 Tax=Saccostrea cuccullata TaxID=36930 RepID=UPI002ED0F248
MYMYISFRNFLLLQLSCIIHVQSQSKDDFIDAFDCFGSVVRAYKTFSNGCDWNIAAYCSKGEITCHRSTKSCTYWRKYRRVQVSFSLNLSSSILINNSEELIKLSKRCYCEDYIINCSVNSEILINNLVHDNTCVLSPMFTASTKAATRKVTTTTLGTDITTSRATDSTTELKQTQENKNSTCSPNYKQEYLKASSENETAYGAIIGALLGGIVLGAALEFLITTLFRRAQIKKEGKKDIGEVKLTSNPAYDCSSLKMSVDREFDEKTTGHLYTQITQNQSQKNSLPKHEYENTGQRKVMMEDELYNHLNVKKETDRVDYYDHASVVPISTHQESYDTLKLNSNDSNTYTEVVGEGFKIKENNQDFKEKEYVVLEK